jgi:hypothetical protein
MRIFLAEFRLPVTVRILVLAACLPLLLPPGLCACGASRHLPARAPTAEPAVRVVPAECCSHGHHHARAATEPATVPPAQTPAAPQDQHAPGCPVVRGIDGLVPSASGGSLEIHAPCLLANIDFRPLTVAALARKRLTDHGCQFHAGLPLYLSHCALLF